MDLDALSETSTSTFQPEDNASTAAAEMLRTAKEQSAAAEKALLESKVQKTTKYICTRGIYGVIHFKNQTVCGFDVETEARPGDLHLL